MKDSRITVYTNPTSISSATTTAGPDIDLWDGVVPVSGTFYGTNPYCGVGAQILVSSFSGTGTPTLKFYWEISDDGNSYDRHSFIGVVDEDTVDDNGFQELRTALRSTKRYARITAVSTGSTIAATVNAYAEDLGVSLYSESING